MRMDTLADGSTLEIRAPILADLKDLMGLFASLPESDRIFLRFDLTNEAVVERLIRESMRGDAQRLIGIVDGKIAAHAALVNETGDWQRHLAELRFIVAPGYRRRGLGSRMITAMVDLARDRGIDKVVAKFPAPQTQNRALFERLGFHVDGVLDGYVVDGRGDARSLVVMSVALDQLSVALREACRDDAWPDG